MVESVVGMGKKRRAKRIDPELRRLLDALEDLDRRATETDRRIETTLKELEPFRRRLREIARR